MKLLKLVVSADQQISNGGVATSVATTRGLPSSLTLDDGKKALPWTLGCRIELRSASFPWYTDAWCFSLRIQSWFYMCWFVPERDFQNVMGLVFFPQRGSNCKNFSGWWFGTLLFILGTIIPTDALIFFRGVGQPPTSLSVCVFPRDIEVIPRAMTQKGCLFVAEIFTMSCNVVKG